MNEMKLLEYLSSKIHEELEVIKESLAAGSAKDYAEYQHMCGKYRGLLTAQSNLTDLKERIEKDDE
jgi:hypothetical protein